MISYPVDCRLPNGWILLLQKNFDTVFSEVTNKSVTRKFPASMEILLAESISEKIVALYSTSNGSRSISVAYKIVRKDRSYQNDKIVYREK